ncbi:MAG: TonB-dependent receptor plug [Verrucomicrobia bacterium]|nr:TonB-dependent receptor plug [Verrucomicrobiota bacterium]
MTIEVTSVSRHAERLLDAPSAIQVVTGDDIRRSGALTIPEALRLADNLDVAQKGSHDWGISARGFNTELANKLLVMIDGRTVYTPLFSGVVWNVQDYLLEDVDQIEVISGPGGTLWGANAVNGVINVTTKTSADTQGWYVEAGAGTAFPGMTAIRYGGALSPKVHFRIYGKYFDRNSEVFSNGAGAKDDWHRGQGGFRVDGDVSPENKFSVQGDLYGGRDSLPAGGEDSVDGGNLLGRWTHTVSEESDFSLQVYYDHTHVKQPAAALVLSGILFAPAGIFEDKLNTYDLDFQHRFPIGSHHHIVWGLGYRSTQDRVTNAPSLAFLPAALDQELFSGFVQDEIRFSPAFALTLGTKVEHNDYTGREIEPSIRIQWNLAESRMLWAAVSRAARTPSRIDRDFSQAAPPFLAVLQGRSTFSSEIVVAHEVGYRAQVGGSVVASVSAFYNEYHDLRSTSLTPATILPFYFANNLEAETYGLEFSADMHVRDGWRLHAGYRVLREDLRIKPGQFDLNNALNETADPKQQFSLRSSLDLPHGLEWDVGLRWVDTRPSHEGATVGSVPSYAEVETRFGWHVTKNVELAVVGQNLLHDQHPEYGYPNSSREEIQRRVYGKATWRY